MNVVLEVTFPIISLAAGVLFIFICLSGWIWWPWGFRQTKIPPSKRGVMQRIAFGVVSAFFVVTSIYLYREATVPRGRPLPKGSLGGTISRSDAKPISGVNVVVWSRESPHVSDHCITTDDGGYSILHISVNEEKTMIIHKDGFQPFEATIPRSEELNQTRAITNVDLLPKTK